MAKRVVGVTVKPPNGWIFSNGYLVPVGNVFTEAGFNAVYAWAKGNRYGLEPNMDNYLYMPNGMVVYCHYTVYTDSWAITEKWFGDGTWTINNETYSIGCTEVMRGGVTYWNQCAQCMRGGLATYSVGRKGQERRLCSACSKACSTRGCKHHINSNAAAMTAKDIRNKCESCAPRERCRFCSVWHPLTSVEKIVGDSEGKFACKTCADQHRCQECGTVPISALVPLKGKKMCQTCYGKSIEKERLEYEKFDPEELPKGGSMQMESLRNRPIRVISVETEVNGHPGSIASTLYNCGLVREPRVESYGTPCPDTSAWPAFLKYDGSVTGGELINFLMEMDKREHARSFLNVLSKMRSLEKLDKVDYSYNCGGHIHIDAHNFSTDNVWRLVTGYNYLEEVIFRLAGAGSEFGHRTLVPGHDAANHGRGYSHPTQKGPWGIKSNVHRALAQQDRMTGLNFVPYFRAVQNCSCGCGGDRLRSCKCTLPKCTIEWRVWNSTGNPRILHAWLAFMQSLHAWADSAKEMTADEEKALPPFAWTKKKFSQTTVQHRTRIFQRVRWIFENLVFTDAERDSLKYAFEHTDIKFPDGFWEEVARIPTPKNRVVKAPRNCSVRRHAISVAIPRKKQYDVDAMVVPAPRRRRNVAPRFVVERRYR